MNPTDKDNIEEKDLMEDIQEEINDIETDEGSIDEEKLGEAVNGESNEVTKLKEALARQQADYDNFQKRVERDKQDMVFFLKSDIFKKILPRVDDLERIIKNTPEEMQTGALFEGIVSLEKTLKKDLDGLGVKPFDSVGEEVNPDMHDVMTTIPGKPEGIIADEFEKGYTLGEKVLRHAKVVAGAGE